MRSIKIIMNFFEIFKILKKGEGVKMREGELTLQEIQRYAKNKTMLIASAFIIAIISMLVAFIFFSLEGLAKLGTHIGLPAIVTYIITSMVALIGISHYEKVRNKLINKVDTKTFKIFFDYFKNMQNKKKNYVYYEVKDIFMYGLWNLKDRNPYLKYISETDSLEFEFNDIKNKVNKKEFLASSIFRCLTFHKNAVLYRNQRIFLNQEKFIDIIKAYSNIFFNEKYHTEEYIKECHKIEENYFDDKTYAIEHYEGLSKKIGRVERFVNFSNNARSVKDLKKVLAVFAFIGLIVQHINEDTSIMVTILYNCITIVLLLVDVAQRNDSNTLH